MEKIQLPRRTLSRNRSCWEDANFRWNEENLGSDFVFWTEERSMKLPIIGLMCLTFMASHLQGKRFVKNSTKSGKILCDAARRFLSRVMWHEDHLSLQLFRERVQRLETQCVMWPEAHLSRVKWHEDDCHRNHFASRCERVRSQTDAERRSFFETNALGGGVNERCSCICAYSLPPLGIW